MKRILVIEDDLAIAEIEKDFLEIEGFHVTLCPDGLEGMREILTRTHDLVLLDLMLPSMGGIEICKAVRSQVDIPIIMVTAKAEDDEKIRGLGLGADDYVAKPFSPTELVARVKANLAQYERLKNAGSDRPAPDKRDTIRIGRIQANLVSHRVYIGERELDLKNKEYELLVFLMSNPDTVFSKEQLYENIWGMDAFGDLKTVAVHINRLREKVEKNPQSPELIQTVWGAGYRFKL